MSIYVQLKNLIPDTAYLYYPVSEEEQDCGLARMTATYNEQTVMGTHSEVVMLSDRLIAPIDAEDAAWAQPAPYTGPPVPQMLTALDFRRRFTMEEKVAIYTVAKTEVALQVFLDDLAVSTFVDINDPITQAGVQMLEQAGVLAVGRANEILA